MKTARWFGILYLSFCLWLLLFPPWMELSRAFRQTRHTSFHRLSQSGPSLAVFRAAPLAVAGRRAAEFLGPELGGTDRLSADAL